jgi:transposase
MQQTVIVGIDVSKKTLDIFCKPQETFLQIPNTVAGFKAWLAKLRELNIDHQSLMVVMEHTGRYSHRFEVFLQKHSIGYCKVAALQIKRSLGVTRGKSDQIDARRIAEYGWLRKESLVADQPVPPVIEQLRDLLSLRKKIVADRAGYKGRLKEMMATGSCRPTSIEAQIQSRIIAGLGKEIQKLNELIEELIKADAELSKTSKLLQSIQGVGPVVAAYMICYTNNFKKFTNARKFNCYAGLAPFDHQSGTSIRGRSRTSHLANKEAKTLLNMAAFSAVNHNQEMKEYYHRRVAEGKRKMSCLNIIRAKIVSRMFALIKRDTPYYQIAA